MLLMSWCVSRRDGLLSPHTLLAGKWRSVAVLDTFSDGNAWCRFRCFTTTTTVAIMDHAQPNLVPPITTTEQAIEYRNKLKAIEPHVHYLMTLYLTPELTPEEIRKAAAAGIA